MFHFPNLESSEMKSWLHTDQSCSSESKGLDGLNVLSHQKNETSHLLQAAKVAG